MPDIHSFEPIWPNWVIDEVIGRGSFGTVWKAHREDRYSKITQNAAVKHISIPSETVRNEMDDLAGVSRTTIQKLYDRELEQLVKEIEAMVNLRGLPHIVAYEEHEIVRKPEGMGYDLFLRMELLTSLPSHARDLGGLGRDEVFRLGVHLLRALETLQNKKLIHRDIKPANIFIDANGNYKLGDFGTARALQATGYASTRTGTPNYMAPEVYNGNANYDQTVDIYSLGIVLYRYLNRGFLPFVSEESMNQEMAIIRRTQGQPMPPPCLADEGQSRVILKACAYRPEDRYQSAREMREAWENARRGRGRADCEIRVTCLLEGSLNEIHSLIEVYPAGREARVDAPQLPGYEVVGQGSERIVVDAAGKCRNDRVTFLYRLEQTVVTRNEVPVICRLETGEEVYRGQAEVKPGEVTWVYPPALPGYEVTGEKWLPVSRGADGRNSPEVVQFRVRRAVPPPQQPPEGGEAREASLSGKGRRTQRQAGQGSVPPPGGKKRWWIALLLGLLAIGMFVFLRDALRPPAPPLPDEPVTQAPVQLQEAAPTAEALPAAVPTARPTQAPTAVQTARPTRVPTAVPTARPTQIPTAVPTARPTQVPTAVPTARPTQVPTAVPTARPTRVPTAVPTARPTQVPTAVPTARPTQAPTAAPTAVPVSPWDSVYRVGSTVTFGMYEQDNQKSAGEDIQWRVLAREGSAALLLSVYGLDTQLYHTRRVDITWEDSSLRKWLNGTFFKAAFSAQEQKAIMATTLQNDNNSRFGTRGGSDTKDKVFLLSLDEAGRYLGGNLERLCMLTRYAKARGAYQNNDTGAGWWWLRSPGDEQARAASVSSKSPVDAVGNGVNVKGGLVRPAIWVNIDALP